MQISIIIPHYNRDDLTNKLVESLRTRCGSHDLQIVVVDDFSDIPYANPKVLVARGQKNDGFLKTCNAGLQIASGEIKVLLSNDVLVTGDFIPQLEKVIKDSPLSLVGNRLISWDSGWNRFDRIYPFLEGWFLAASAEVWEDLGGFDECFSPNDYEDTDLSTTAYSLGFPVISLDTPYLKHLGAQTLKYSPEREKITCVNREKFRNKWCSTSKNAEGK
jgi:GT2 family glycosyltransferase